jgi:hypothetical protein
MSFSRGFYRCPFFIRFCADGGETANRVIPPIYFLEGPDMTKKLLIVITLLFIRTGDGFCATVLSGNEFSENWLMLHFDYGCFFKNPLDTETTMDNQFGGLGSGLSFYSFRNFLDIGFYLHAYLLFPGVTISQKTGGLITTEEQVDNLMGAIIGPVYRIFLESDSYLHIAAGLHFRFFTGTYSSMMEGVGGKFQYDLSGYQIGIGGDVGIKYNMSEIFSLNFGLGWTMDFVGDVFLDDPSRALPHYSWISVKPYLGVGIAFSYDKSWYVYFGNE